MRATRARILPLLGAITAIACNACGGAGKNGSVEPDGPTAARCEAMPTDTLRHGDSVATVTVDGAPDGPRRYELRSTAPLRDDLPADGRRLVEERAGQLVARTGHDLFDALVAMAVDEVRQASVSSIRDASFDGGEPIDCECFETGEKWTYVWTRDTAYAVDLALAWLDPGRAAESLRFKLSRPKAGGPLQIVQDTGSGGSWPVSTDRAVWALGARAVLDDLDGAERDAFRDTVYEAVTETAELDRRYVFDDADGLYRGEQSFLDWREQSYPRWTAEDTTHIAMSKALSTNVAHLALLELAADLAAEKGQQGASDRYRGWASALRQAIHRALWLPDEGLYATFQTTALDPSPVRRFDLLGVSLAVLHGVGDTSSARTAVASYPRSDVGAPVMWPQAPFIPIYHNRGMWPFVSAYSLLAARRVGNARVFDHDAESLVRAAALNLSNMENFDFATGAAYTGDGDDSGPVVNSRRQLWSVAGYLAMVVRGIFGVEVERDGIRVEPFLTYAMHRRYFAGQDRIELRDLPVAGGVVDVALELPPCQEGDGAFRVGRVLVDGTPVEGTLVPRDPAGPITVELIPGTGGPGALRTVDAGGDPRAIFSPREPAIRSVTPVDGALVVDIDPAGEDAVAFEVYRDGALVAGDVTATSWRDEGATDFATTTHCYAVAARYRATGTRSHHSPPVCHWGEDRVTEFGAADLVRTGGALSGDHGRTHVGDWGRPGDELELPSFTAQRSGRHMVQLVYANGSGPVNTGITAGVKWLAVEDLGSGEVVGEGALVMPHRGDWGVWAESTLVPVELEAGSSYRLRIRDGFNMSQLAHFARYGGAGGGPEPHNLVNVAALRVLRY